MYLSMTFLASSACLFASAMSSEEVLTERSINNLAAAAASTLAALIGFTTAGWKAKQLTVIAVGRGV